MTNAELGVVNRAISKVSDGLKAPPRRSMGYWQSFNSWYRAFWKQHSRRPAVSDVRRWWESTEDGVWGEDDKPTWEETRLHSKCLRSLDQVKSYFRHFRAVKRQQSDGDVPDAALHLSQRLHRPSGRCHSAATATSLSAQTGSQDDDRARDGQRHDDDDDDLCIDDDFNPEDFDLEQLDEHITQLEDAGYLDEHLGVHRLHPKLFRAHRPSADSDTFEEGNASLAQSCIASVGVATSNTASPASKFSSGTLDHRNGGGVATTSGACGGSAAGPPSAAPAASGAAASQAGQQQQPGQGTSRAGRYHMHVSSTGSGSGAQLHGHGPGAQHPQQAGQQHSRPAAIRMVFGGDAPGQRSSIMIQHSAGDSLPLPISVSAANSNAPWLMQQGSGAAAAGSGSSTGSPSKLPPYGAPGQQPLHQRSNLAPAGTRCALQAHPHGQQPHGQQPHGQHLHGQQPHGQHPHGQQPHGQHPHGQHPPCYPHPHHATVTTFGAPGRPGGPPGPSPLDPMPTWHPSSSHGYPPCAEAHPHAAGMTNSLRSFYSAPLPGGPHAPPPSLHANPHGYPNPYGPPPPQPTGSMKGAGSSGIPGPQASVSMATHGSGAAPSAAPSQSITFAPRPAGSAMTGISGPQGPTSSISLHANATKSQQRPAGSAFAAMANTGSVDQLTASSRQAGAPKPPGSEAAGAQRDKGEQGAHPAMMPPYPYPYDPYGAPYPPYGMDPYYGMPYPPYGYPPYGPPPPDASMYGPGPYGMDPYAAMYGYPPYGYPPYGPDPYGMPPGEFPGASRGSNGAAGSGPNAAAGAGSGCAKGDQGAGEAGVMQQAAAGKQGGPPQPPFGAVPPPYGGMPPPYALGRAPPVGPGQQPLPPFMHPWQRAPGQQGPSAPGQPAPRPAGAVPGTTSGQPSQQNLPAGGPQQGAWAMAAPGAGALGGRQQPTEDGRVRVASYHIEGEDRRTAAAASGAPAANGGGRVQQQGLGAPPLDHNAQQHARQARGSSGGGLDAYDMRVEVRVSSLAAPNGLKEGAPPGDKPGTQHGGAAPDAEPQMGSPFDPFDGALSPFGLDFKSPEAAGTHRLGAQQHQPSSGARALINLPQTPVAAGGDAKGGWMLMGGNQQVAANIFEQTPEQAQRRPGVRNLLPADDDARGGGPAGGGGGALAKIAAQAGPAQRLSLSGLPLDMCMLDTLALPDFGAMDGSMDLDALFASPKQ